MRRNENKSKKTHRFKHLDTLLRAHKDIAVLVEGGMDNVILGRGPGADGAHLEFHLFAQKGLAQARVEAHAVVTLD